MEYIAWESKSTVFVLIQVGVGGKNHVQEPSIDFQCSLTVLAALRAAILFVPHALVQLLLSEST